MKNVVGVHSILGMPEGWNALVSWWESTAGRRPAEPFPLAPHCRVTDPARLYAFLDGALARDPAGQVRLGLRATLLRLRDTDFGRALPREAP